MVNKLNLARHGHILNQGQIEDDYFVPPQCGMPQSHETQWLGSHYCDACGEECGRYLYDVKTNEGSWGVLCERCWPIHGNPGLRLGIGFGQKYERREHGNYYKVEG